MKHFKKFDEFFNHLIDSINDGKDVYVFGYTYDDKTDYQLINEDNSNDYYVQCYVDFHQLQETLSVYFVDERDLVITFDYINELDEEDNSIITYKRLYIFRSK